MADFENVLERTVYGLAENSFAERAMVYAKARGAVNKQLRSIDPPPSEQMIARQMAKLEDAINRTERLMSGCSVTSHPEAVQRSSKSQITTAERERLDRTAFLVELLVPVDLATDFISNLKEIHAEKWLPQYGARRAKWIWHRQCLGLIVRHWFDVAISAAERIVKLQKS